MVRIVEPLRKKKGAIGSLLVAIVAAAGVWAGYLAWDSDNQDSPVVRGPEDHLFSWRCHDGHVFTAKGACRPRACSCGQPAYPVLRYRCPRCKDGPRELRVMFDEATRLVRDVEVTPGKWVPASPIVRCPECGGELLSMPKLHPMDRKSSAKDEKAGGTESDLPS